MPDHAPGSRSVRGGAADAVLRLPVRLMAAPAKNRTGLTYSRAWILDRRLATGYGLPSVETAPSLGPAGSPRFSSSQNREELRLHTLASIEPLRLVIEAPKMGDKASTECSRALQEAEEEEEEEEDHVWSYMYSPKLALHLHNSFARICRRR